MSISPDLTDDELEGNVQSALHWISGIGGTRLGVTVFAGAVTLSGEVDSVDEKRLAAETVMSVHGVRAITQEIVIRRPIAGDAWVPQP